MTSVTAMRRQWWAACAVLTMLGAACADDADVAQPDIDLTGATRVDALDNSFRAQTLTVAAGTEVVFVNVGRNVHDVKPAAGSSDWGVDQRQFACTGGHTRDRVLGGGARADGDGEAFGAEEPARLCRQKGGCHRVDRPVEGELDRHRVRSVRRRAHAAAEGRQQGQDDAECVGPVCTHRDRTTGRQWQYRHRS